MLLAMVNTFNLEEDFNVRVLSQKEINLHILF